MPMLNASVKYWSTSRCSFTLPFGASLLRGVLNAWTLTALG
jgi:hypothetical protein